MTLTIQQPGWRWDISFADSLDNEVSKAALRSDKRSTEVKYESTLRIAGMRGFKETLG